MTPLDWLVAVAGLALIARVNGSFFSSEPVVRTGAAPTS